MRAMFKRIFVDRPPRYLIGGRRRNGEYEVYYAGNDPEDALLGVMRMRRDDRRLAASSITIHRRGIAEMAVFAVTTTIGAFAVAEWVCTQIFPASSLARFALSIPVIFAAQIGFRLR